MKKSDIINLLSNFTEIEDNGREIVSIDKHSLSEIADEIIELSKDK